MSFITPFSYFDQLAKQHMHHKDALAFHHATRCKYIALEAHEHVVIAYNNILASLNDEYQARFKRFMNVCFYKLGVKPSDYSEYEQLLVQSVALQYFICP